MIVAQQLARCKKLDYIRKASRFPSIRKVKYTWKPMRFAGNTEYTYYDEKTKKFKEVDLSQISVRALNFIDAWIKMGEILPMFAFNPANQIDQYAWKNFKGSGLEMFVNEFISQAFEKSSFIWIECV